MVATLIEDLVVVHVLRVDLPEGEFWAATIPGRSGVWYSRRPGDAKAHALAAYAQAILSLDGQPGIIT